MSNFNDSKPDPKMEAASDALFPRMAAAIKKDMQIANEELGAHLKDMERIARVRDAAPEMLDALKAIDHQLIFWILTGRPALGNLADAHNLIVAALNKAMGISEDVASKAYKMRPELFGEQNVASSETEQKFQEKINGLSYNGDE